MNCWNCIVKPLGTGFAAVINRVDRAEPYYISERGKRLSFPTEEGAELAGLRHILWLLQTEPRFTAPPARVENATSLQEATFGTVKNRKGKETAVERRKRRKRTKARRAAAQQAEASA